MAVYGLLFCKAIPSFIQVSNPYQATIKSVKQFQGDPARYVVGTSMGTLGIMLENRRRNLLNGIISRSKDGCLHLDVYQALGNCPKYIQVRHLEPQALLPAKPEEAQATAVLQGHLPTEQLNIIARSDTFFIASTHQASQQETGGPQGCQLNHVNHRGSFPGFIQAQESGKLVWGDYVGNNTFTTLGNLLVNPEAALLFIDFTTGDTLHLSGHAEVQWQKTDLPGAQRTVAFQTEEWVHVKGALPFSHKGPVESSPYNPTPPQTSGRPEALAVQRLNCISTTMESFDVMTFKFELPKLPANKSSFCKPGQFASFDFEDITPGEVINRTWTISSPAEHIRRHKTFTISIKKDGLVSNWMFNNMRPGKTIAFKGVDGDFTLGLAATTPHSRVLLVAAGIGITPMRVLLSERLSQQQPVSLLHFVRTLREAPFLQELVQAAQNSNGLFTLAVSVTRPTQKDLNHMAHSKQERAVTWHQGRINTAMVNQVCPDAKSCLVFQCGPTAMMQLVSATLESMHVPVAHVFQEAFNF